MSNAPEFNSINTHTGAVFRRPSKFWQALDDAHSYTLESQAAVDENHELRVRVQELEAELADLRSEIAVYRAVLTS